MMAMPLSIVPDHVLLEASTLSPCTQVMLVWDVTVTSSVDTWCALVCRYSLSSHSLERVEGSVCCAPHLHVGLSCSQTGAMSVHVVCDRKARDCFHQAFVSSDFLEHHHYSSKGACPGCSMS
jgi:hypothetical protein